MNKQQIKRAFALVSCIILFYACKKEMTISASEAIDSKQMKDWYLQNVNRTESNPFSSMEPDWNKVHTSDQDSLEVFEITLNNPEKVLLAGEGSDQSNIASYADKNTIQLIIFKNKKTGNITTAGYMSVLSDRSPINSNDIHYKQVGKLNGKVLYYHLNGDFNNGWQYNDGVIISRFSKGTEQGYLATKQMQANSNGSNRKLLMSEGGMVCETIPVDVYREICVGYEGYMRCDRVKKGTTPVKRCADPGDGDGGGGFGGGGGGGGSTPASVPNLDLSELADYPEFKKVISNLPAFLKKYNNIVKALSYYTGFSESKINELMQPGKGPKIYVVDNLKSSDNRPVLGQYDRSTGKLQIDGAFVRGLDIVKSPERYEVIGLLLTVTTLHEFVHYGRDANNLPYKFNGYEAGLTFEQNISPPGSGINDILPDNAVDWLKFYPSK